MKAIGMGVLFGVIGALVFANLMNAGIIPVSVTNLLGKK